MMRLERQPESQNIEWKESWRDDYLKWICGFANAKGGKLFVGVDDSGEVVGVKNSKRLLEDIPSKIQMSLGIVADVDLRAAEGKDYLEITVQPSSFPVSYRGEFHYRSGSTKRQLTGFALADFVMRRTGTHWDEAPVPGVSLADVDAESIQIFKREALRHRRMTAEELDVSVEELLERLGVLKDGVLTRAGVLLFTSKHFAAQTATYTKVGMFGEERFDLLYEDVFDGPLVTTAARIVQTIYLKYLRGKISYEGVTRVETYPFEYDAVREGIYNALIHNVYMTGSPIQIRIDEHTMEISNSCILPEDWTVDSLLQTHTSEPYNPSIANVFYRMGYIENWGRGVEKIEKACAVLGAPKPEYTMLGYGITLRLRALESAIIGTSFAPKGHNDAINVPINGDNGPINVPINGEMGTSKGASGGEIDNTILNAIANNPQVTLDDLASNAGVTRKTIQRHVAALKDAGIIRRVGARKNGRWEVVA